MKAGCVKFGRAGRLSSIVLAIGVLLISSCSAFNPAFLSLIAPGGQDEFATVPNPPGHVIVAFINNTRFDDRLIAYLAPQLELSDTEIRALRPRVRLRVQIQFADGTTQTVEMIDGTKSFIEPGFDAEAFVDLNENDLRNIVVQCDVAGVSISPNSNIDVFIPTELVGFQLVETTGTGGQTVTEFQERQRIAPAFRVLQVDDIDDDRNVVLQRNIGFRDQPSPVTDLRCGSVVAITMNGVLSVPFLDIVSSTPSFDIDDQQTVARIGGRFVFNVTVQ